MVIHDTWIVMKKKSLMFKGETNQSATSDLVEGSHVNERFVGIITCE